MASCENIENLPKYSAAALEDPDDALALIRHADRALYVGAKRAGRNKFAEYVK
ncbi:hypothetical protein PB1_15899 [Bacillus methanolicus PB1]|uniref:GGDEF domain-containing protein n=1 Tax=Bacillus methanolicus PB1 TaxID=997296 RepID=I3DXT5_BACMT|nr:hypothetical protein [Bacillus methanolicus]EIJ79056.1 hypothetical protein PB1_15899 [Bacillus methanolicus PB1]